MDIKQQLEELRATIEENATDEQKEQIKEAQEQHEKQQKYEKFLHDLHGSVGEISALERRVPVRFSEKVWKQRRKHTAEVKASRRRNRG